MSSEIESRIPRCLPTRRGRHLAPLAERSRCVRASRPRTPPSSETLRELEDQREPTLYPQNDQKGASLVRSKIHFPIQSRRSHEDEPQYIATSSHDASVSSPSAQVIVAVQVYLSMKIPGKLDSKSQTSPLIRAGSDNRFRRTSPISAAAPHACRRRRRGHLAARAPCPPSAPCSSAAR